MTKSPKRQTCDQCKRPTSHCYCRTIKHINNLWPVHILQHKLEDKHPLGTARIARLSLAHCDIHPLTDERLDLPILDSKPLLIYPGEDAQDIDTIDKNTIRPLIFIDATWRKSRRVLYENPKLNELDKVSFTPNFKSRYRIRKEPKDNFVSTLEAIAHVLSVLEGDNKKYEPMLRSMDYIIETQIANMGEETFHKHYLE
jgi:DTW domain-containing protein YfiP